MYINGVYLPIFVLEVFEIGTIEAGVDVLNKSKGFAAVLVALVVGFMKLLSG